MNIYCKSHCMIRNLYCLYLFMFIIFSISSCHGEPGSGTHMTQERLTIAYPRTVYAVLFHIACEKGFFRKEGLDVTGQPHTIGKYALKSAIDGNADLAISSDTAVMFAVVNMRKISTISVIATSKKNEAIVAWKDRGINTPENLKQKRIGVTTGTTAHFFLDSFLTIHGIDKKQIKVIDIKPEELSNALLTKKVDAVAIWNPHMKQLEKKLGGRGTVFYDESIYSDVVCVSGLQEYIRKNPDTIKKVLRALLKAETFVKQSPDESKKLVAEFVKVDKAIIDEIWDSINFRVTLDQFLLVNLEDETRWAQQNKLTDSKERPNYLDFIYFDGLQSIKPGAVRIIR